MTMYLSTLSHKWHDFSGGGGGDIDHKCVFWFLLQLLSEKICHLKKNWAQQHKYLHEMYSSAILVRFQWNLEFFPIDFLSALTVTLSSVIPTRVAVIQPCLDQRAILVFFSRKQSPDAAWTYGTGCSTWQHLPAPTRENRQLLASPAVTETTFSFPWCNSPPLGFLTRIHDHTQTHHTK